MSLGRGWGAAPQVSLAFDPTAEAGALPCATLRMQAAPGAAPLSIPADYELTFQTGAAPMVVFSRDNPAGGPKRVAVEGKVPSPTLTHARTRPWRVGRRDGASLVVGG